MSSTGKRPRLLRTVEAVLRDAGIRDGSAVLAGVSGGPDSTCLLHVLSVLSPTMGFLPFCCTVDHGIRPAEECSGDAEHVRSLCQRLGIPFLLSSIPAGACERASRTRRASLEETARDMRFQLLSHAAEANGCGWILLGHTRDDQAETMVMRFFQGSDPSGLKGIPGRRGRILRPLLSCARSEILDHLREEGIPYRSDPTNEEDRFLRSRVRHGLLPAAAAVFPGYLRSLEALAGKLALWADFISREAERRLPWREECGVLRMERGDFFTAHPALRMQALYSAYQRLRPEDGPKRLPWRFLEPALGMDPPGDRGTLAQGHGITVRYERKGFSVSRSIVSGCKKGYLIVVEAGGEYPVRGTRFAVRCSVREGDGLSGREICMPASEIGSPCVLRSRRPGDVLACGGDTLSLKKLYSQWHVPETLRGTIPVLSDRKGIFLVLGGVLGYRDRQAQRSGRSGGGLTMCFTVQRR